MAQRSSWGSNAPAKRKGYRYLRFTADTGDGRGLARHRVTFKGTKREGDEELRRLWHRYVESAGERRRPPTVAECYERWYLPSCRARIAEGKYKERSLDTMISAWRANVGPRWGDVAVTGVRPLEVNEWLSGMTGATSGLCRTMLRQVLEFAVLYEAIPSNPVRGRVLVTKRNNEQLRATWDLEALDRIWGAHVGSPDEASIILQAFGLARVGESLAPASSDVTMEERHGMRLALVPLTRQYLCGYGMTDDGDMKNEQSVRAAVLPEPWSLRIEQLAGDGRAMLSDNGFGEPPGRKWQRDHFRKAIARAGVDDGTLRNLRASCRTWMEWHTGLSYQKLEKLMGHAAGDVTARSYNRPDAEDMAEVVARAFTDRPVRSGTWESIR